MTARWVVDEVAPARDLEVVWEPISLFLVNDPPPDSRRFPPLQRTHRLLRVMESVRAADGEAAVFRLYWEYGRRIHHDQVLDFDVAEALRASGNDEAHAAAFDDDGFDAEIRRRHDAGIALAGDDIGTPIIALDDRNGVPQAYFGPVITRVPPTDDALALWDALVTMMNVEGFWELKRSRTEGPDVGPRP